MGNLTVFDLFTGKLKQKLKISESGIDDLSVSPGNNFLAVVFLDGKSKLLDA